MEIIRLPGNVVIHNHEIIQGELSIGIDDLDLDPHRSTRGRLYRRRVNKIPSIEFTLKPLKRDKMDEIMRAVDPQDIWVEYFDVTKNEWWRAEFYVPSDYRKPKVLRMLPSLVFDNHDMKFIGIDKGVKL